MTDYDYWKTTDPNDIYLEDEEFEEEPIDNEEWIGYTLSMGGVNRGCYMEDQSIYAVHDIDDNLISDLIWSEVKAKQIADYSRGDKVVMYLISGTCQGRTS